MIDDKLVNLRDLKAVYDSIIDISNDMIAPTEASTTASMAHAVGDYFILGDTLYVATAAIAVGDTIVTSGAGANCRAAVLGDEVAGLKSAINPLIDNLPKISVLEKYDGITIITDFTQGKKYRTTGSTVDINAPTADSDWYCTYIECNAGDKFTYTGVGTASYRQYAFLDANGIILEKGPNAYAHSVVLTAPANAKYCVFNFYKTGDRVLWKGAKDAGMVEVTNFYTGKGYNTSGSSIDINNPTGPTTNVINCAFVACKAGDRFTYTGLATNSYRAYAFIDNAGTILEIPPNFGYTVHEMAIIAPENSAYVVFNYHKAYYHAIFIGYDPDNGKFNFEGAKVAIIGDSICTNGDWSTSNPFGNVPEIIISDADVGVQLSAYATYYDIGTTVGGHEIVASDVGTEITFTPVVEDVGKVVGKPQNYNDESTVTWWQYARGVLGFDPIPVCWSGASITSHEGTSDSYKTSYAWHPAQIRKCGIRTPGTMTRVAPDMIIISRGTNDFSHSPYAKLTADYFDYPWTYPSTDEITDGFGFKEGLCLTIRKLREAYPEAQIVLCTCNFFKRVNYSSYPINNGQYTENQLNEAIREVASWMGCKLIEFDKDGLTFENASSTYYQDTTAFTHPTTKGHKILANRALRDMQEFNNMKLPLGALS